MEAQTNAPATAPTGAPPLSLDELREIVMPDVGERVIEVPQCSYHLVDLADRGGLVGLPAAAVEPYISSKYGSPFWRLRDRYDPRIGNGLLVIRDGIIRRGPQNWDSSD